MQRVKKRIFSGCVCEQLVFSVPDGIKNVAKLEPKRPRFKTETEREEHRVGISRRNHARLVNENFTPESLYSTLTLSNEYEVHTFETVTEKLCKAATVSLPGCENHNLHGPRKENP